MIKNFSILERIIKHTNISSIEVINDQKGVLLLSMGVIDILLLKKSISIRYKSINHIINKFYEDRNKKIAVRQGLHVPPPVYDCVKDLDSNIFFQEMQYIYSILLDHDMDNVKIKEIIKYLEETEFYDLEFGTTIDNKKNVIFVKFNGLQYFGKIPIENYIFHDE